jgi:hypothetical protein
MHSPNAPLIDSDSVDPDIGAIEAITVTVVASLIYFINRFDFKSSSTHATTKISLDRSGVVRIYGACPVNSGNAEVPASDSPPAAKTEASKYDSTEVPAVRAASHYPAGIGSVVGWLVVLEIAKWIW